MTSGQISYDDVPYDSGANSGSHPMRLATLGAVFGMDTPDIRTARVLEVGCSVGSNLLSIAYGLPGATCVGIDLSEGQIEIARRRASELGLTNVTFEVADLAEYRAEEPFDYIIALGVFSWISEPLRERLLALCGELLAPNGIAYLTYNIYPGWYLRQPFRDLMLMTAAGDTSRERIARAAQVLDFVARASGAAGGSGNEIFANAAGKESATVNRLPAEYVAHEHLESSNAPVYFKDFVELASRHGLQYLSDTSLASMFPSELPQKIQEELQRFAPSQVAIEQMLDFVRGRQFRQTLLCRSTAELSRDISKLDIRPFFLSSGGVIEREKDETEQEVVRFKSGGSTIRLNSAVFEAALVRLVDAWPRQVAFDELFDVSVTESQRAEVAVALTRMYLMGMIRAEIARVPLPANVEERPVASRLARVTKYGEQATNLLHAGVPIEPIEGELLDLADGTRDRVQLVKALAERIRNAEPGSELAGVLSEGQSLADLVDQGLKSMLEQALLEPNESPVGGQDD
jgi:methyltransferase-like protein/SAM-dependent methyltransferase